MNGAVAAINVIQAALRATASGSRVVTAPVQSRTLRQRASGDTCATS